MNQKAKRSSQSEPDGPQMFEDVVPTAASTPEKATADIEASACLPNQECPLTPNCRGRLHAFNTVNFPEPDENGQLRNVRKQQLKCTKCGKMPSGHRVISNQSLGRGTLYNRVTGRAD